MMASRPDSSESDSSPTSPLTGRRFQRELVWLKERLSSTPRGHLWDTLNRDGRVKEASFYTSMSSKHTRKVIYGCFPQLKNADPKRIYLYKSANRGSEMVRVSKGIPDTKKLKEICGGATKRLYLYVKRSRPAVTNPIPQAPVSGVQTSGSATPTVPPATCISVTPVTSSAPSIPNAPLPTTQATTTGLLTSGTTTPVNVTSVTSSPLPIFSTAQAPAPGLQTSGSSRPPSPLAVNVTSDTSSFSPIFSTALASAPGLLTSGSSTPPSPPAINATSDRSSFLPIMISAAPLSTTQASAPRLITSGSITPPSPSAVNATSDTSLASLPITFSSAPLSSTPLLTNTTTVAVRNRPQATADFQNHRPPRNGRETRRYLSVLAQLGQTGDNGLLQSPTQDNTINISPSPPVPRQRRRIVPPARTSTITRQTASTTDTGLVQSPGSLADPIVIHPSSPVPRQRRHSPPARTSIRTAVTTSKTGLCGAAFYGDGLRAGTVASDISSIGLGECSSIQSRTDEVVQCQRLLNESVRNEDNSFMPPFLIHSFEEICWQAHDCRRAIVAVILNPANQGSFRNAMLRVLRRLQEESNKGDWFFWVTLSSSKDGQEVLKSYGNGQDDQLIFFVPSTQQRPVFMERVEGKDLQNLNINSLLHKVSLMMQSLALQREQLGHWRLQREEQNAEFMQSLHQDSIEKRTEKDTKETEGVEEKEIDLHEPKKVDEIEREKEDNKIRDKRSSRVTEEVHEGPETVKIVLRHLNGKMERCFKKGAFFQEVYDWAGANNKLPLHFTIQRGRQVIRHLDTLETREVLDVYGRDEAEIKQLLGTKVSFRGNVPSDVNSESELSTTIPDATQEQRQERKEDENKEEQKKEEEKEEGKNEEENKEEERKENQEQGRKEEEKNKEERKEEGRKEEDKNKEEMKYGERNEEAKKEQERKEEEREKQKNEEANT